MKSSHLLSALFASHLASSTAFSVRIHDTRTNIKCECTQVLEARTGHLKALLSVFSYSKCFISSPAGLNPQWQVSGSCQGFRVDEHKAGGGRWVVLCLNLTQAVLMKCHLLRCLTSHLFHVAHLSSDSDAVFFINNIYGPGNISL